MRKPIALLAATALAAAAAVPAFAATKTVKVDDNFFSPKPVSVKKGSTVKWSWVGSAPHNVTAVKGPVKFSSSTKRSGTFRKTMKRKGTYRIVCTIHSGMSMKLVVR
jgi:plastocyanin